MAGSVPIPKPSEIAEGLATLDDWRSMIYVLVILLILAAVERWSSYHRAAKEREKMWEIAQTMGVNAEKIAGAMNDLTAEVKAFRIISARVEGQADAER